MGSLNADGLAEMLAEKLTPDELTWLSELAEDNPQRVVEEIDKIIVRRRNEEGRSCSNCKHLPAKSLRQGPCSCCRLLLSWEAAKGFSDFGGEERDASYWNRH